jgi:hypothetical protein
MAAAASVRARAGAVRAILPPPLLRVRDAAPGSVSSPAPSMPRVTLLTAVLGSSCALAAQCFTPNFGVAIGTPATLVGDVVFAMRPIGFAFPLGGASYSDLHVCDKGYVWLSNGGVPAPGYADFSASANEFANQGPRVAALWADVQALALNGAQVHVDASPTRCVVTWENVTCYGAVCAPFTMQLQLFPSGAVAVFFGEGATNASVGSAVWQAGLTGVSPGNLAAVPAPVDFAAGSGGVAGALVHEAWTAMHAFDLAGRGVVLTPGAGGWTFAPAANCAQAQRFGRGCIRADDSLYETFTAGCDLAQSALRWQRAAAGYVVTRAPNAAFVPPSPAATPVAPGVLDGAQVFALSSPMPCPGGSTAALCVTTKGQVQYATAVPAAIDYTPTAPELLALPKTTFALWHDFDQTAAGSGGIWFEESGGIAYATWLAVPGFTSAAPSTFQFQLDVTTGDVTLVMGALGSVGAPDPAVVGCSAGGPSIDPGWTDLSAIAGALLVEDVGRRGLELAAVGLPIVGNAGFALAASNVPPAVPLAFVAFGSQPTTPALDLGVLGLPGCFGHHAADLGIVAVPAALPAGDALLPLPTPNAPALVGAAFVAQALAFEPLLPGQLATSNGLVLRVGR